MKLIVGLGNPGEAYKNNRHNVGKMVISRLKTLKKNNNQIYKESDVFMNDSGDFVQKQLNSYKLKPSDLYIIHDDLDIKLGEYKIQFGKGPKEHNGINNIQEKLDTKEFWFVRVGVDNRDSKNRTSGEKYVLEDFTNEEKVSLEGVIDQICKKLVTI